MNGVAQQPIHGVSMAYSLTDPEAPGRRHTQHYEMWGNRGLWHDGWMAVCRLHPDAPGAHDPASMVPFDDLVWELYDHAQDPSECEDLAAVHPERLRRLQELWWAAAGRFDVLPVDTRARSARWPTRPPVPAGAEPGGCVYPGKGGPYERGVAPDIAGRSFRLEAEVDMRDGGTPDGVLYAVGGVHGGYWWYLHDGELAFEVAQSSVTTQTIAVPATLSSGRHRLAVELAAHEDGAVTWPSGSMAGGSARAGSRDCCDGSRSGVVGLTSGRRPPGRWPASSPARLSSWSSRRAHRDDGERARCRGRRGVRGRAARPVTESSAGNPTMSNRPPGDTGEGSVGRTVADSRPWWPPRPSERRPNVVVIVLDDVGFAQLGCYGASTATPNMDALAERGLRYTTSTPRRCVPTRASLLTGRNHHAVGMGFLAAFDTGFPSYRGRVSSRGRGDIGELLRDAGYDTYAVGSGI